MRQEAVRVGTVLRWRLILIGFGVTAAAIVNLSLLPDVFEHLRYGEPGRDFTVTFERVIHLDNPYSVPYLWSPLAVPLLSLVVPLGYGFWSLLHGLALLLIRPLWVAVAVGVSWPFWWDIASGNVGIFVFVAAWWAVRGNRAGIVVYLVMCLLMPRPLMAPVAVWLLWKEPWTRVPFVAAGIAQLGIVAWMGLLDDWAAQLLNVVPAELAKESGAGLSRWIGYWSLLLLPVAAWLTYKGRLGLASVAASPYVFPFYLLMLGLELRPGTGSRASSPGWSWPWQFPKRGAA